MIVTGACVSSLFFLYVVIDFPEYMSIYMSDGDDAINVNESEDDSVDDRDTMTSNALNDNKTLKLIRWLFDRVSVPSEWILRRFRTIHPGQYLLVAARSDNYHASGTPAVTTSRPVNLTIDPPKMGVWFG